MGRGVKWDADHHRRLQRHNATRRKGRQPGRRAGKSSSACSAEASGWDICQCKRSGGRVEGVQKHTASAFEVRFDASAST